ncbi:uncharacterized protein [Penaeus vannamei]|uniref:uncharacterized protein n=1 Tax=Penaeus vannamei TaxID=6689 RepID=UPI00387F992A
MLRGLDDRNLLSVCLCACACDPFSRAEFGREDASGDLLVRLEGLVGGSGVAGGGGGAGVPNMTMGVSVAGNMGGCEEVGVVSCPVCSKRVQLSYLSLHLKRTHDSLEVRSCIRPATIPGTSTQCPWAARRPRLPRPCPRAGITLCSRTGQPRPPTSSLPRPISFTRISSRSPVRPPSPWGLPTGIPHRPPRPHRPLGSGTTPTQRRARPQRKLRPHLSAHTRHNLLTASGLDLLRAFEYGATVTDLGLHGGALGGTYLDARGGGLPSGVCGAGGGGGAPGGGGPGGGVPWRRPLGGSDGYVSCPQCQKPITSYNLNRHVRMVHSNMEHATCPVCSKEFKNKYSLATHMHRQHSDPGGASGQPRTTTC